MESVRGHSIAGAPQCWNLGFSIMPRDHAAGGSRERDRRRFRATKLWGSVDGSCGDGKWWTGLIIEAKDNFFRGGGVCFFWWDGACFFLGGCFLKYIIYMFWNNIVWNFIRYSKVLHWVEAWWWHYNGCHWTGDCGLGEDRNQSNQRVETISPYFTHQASSTNVYL